jgi:hypothetical protein
VDEVGPLLGGVLEFVEGVAEHVAPWGLRSTLPVAMSQSQKPSSEPSSTKRSWRARSSSAASAFLRSVTTSKSATKCSGWGQYTDTENHWAIDFTKISKVSGGPPRATRPNTSAARVGLRQGRHDLADALPRTPASPVWVWKAGLV